MVLAGMQAILGTLYREGLVVNLSAWLPKRCRDSIISEAEEVLREQLRDPERVDLAMAESGVTMEAIRLILKTLVPQRGWKASLVKVVAARKDTNAVMQQLLPIWGTPGSGGHFVSSIRLLQLLLPQYVADMRER